MKERHKKGRVSIVLPFQIYTSIGLLPLTYANAGNQLNKINLCKLAMQLVLAITLVLLLTLITANGISKIRLLPRTYEAQTYE